MSGFFGPGECIDESLAAVKTILSHPVLGYNPDAFVNPQLGYILNLATGSADCRARFTAYVNNPLLHNPADVPFFTACTTQWNELDAYFVTGSAPGSPENGHYGMWTSWLSGKTPMFPFTDVTAIPGLTTGSTPLVTNTAGLAILGTTAFAGMLSIASGATRSAYVTCEIDPAHPCATALGIFGSVMGAFNAVLNAILAGFAAMTNFYGQVEAWINQMLGYVNQFLQWIAGEINKAIKALLDLIQYGMAKLLSALGLHDPCLTFLLNQICSTELKVAIDLPGLPALPEP